jgi:DNA-binding beta-propeller fold protein YncE/mono/diheme cytochrome c family protein
VLIVASSVTHSFNTFKRRLELPFLQSGGRLAVQMPANGVEAPPGYYELFLLDALGVPSNAVLLSLGEDMAAPPVSTLLPRGNVITLQSLNRPDYAMATDAQALGVLKLLGAEPSAADLASARFTVRDGLADSNCVSLESTTTPGQWLRHYAYRLRLGNNDGSEVFKADATFCPELGLSGTGFSLRSKNFPDRVIRHRELELWIDPVVAGAAFADDASFKLREPPLPTLPAIAAPIVASGTVQSYGPAISLQGATFVWDFGDGSAPTAASSSPETSHTYAAPGVYLVTLTVRLADGRTVTKTFVQAVRGPVTAGAPRASSNVALELRSGAAERIWLANPDNDSVSVFDGQALTRTREIAVGASPHSVAVAPDGRIWVAARDAAAISIIDPGTLAVVQTVSLPARSRPQGLLFAPNAALAFVSLDATGQVLQLNATTGAVLKTLDVGPNPRGLSLSADGARLLVSRFISPPAPGESNGSPVTSQAVGELRVVDLPAMTGARIVPLHHSDRTDGPVQGRGVPNYLGAAVIAPDGQSAWLPSKQDNIARGSLRDGQNLDFQSTVRAVTSRIDLSTESELVEKRIDHDNAGVASAAVFHPSGVYLFVSLETSRQVAVVNALNGSELFRMEVGIAPQGLTISADGARLYVQNFLDRTLSVLDLGPLVNNGEFKSATLATVASIASEKLASNVLLGKRLFYDARDPRLARDSYLSCAACHADGGGDGRVWDLTGMGEGLRNTISLLGHAGAQGLLHWSGNFDEVQDFEGQIRALAGGTGLLPDAVFSAGTRSKPLGDAKAGLGADLDALAAYVKSLNQPTPSPFRAANGLTAAGVAGRVVFGNAGCSSCHYGATFAKEDGTGLEDIGTVRSWSGQRAFAPLLGIDVPSLRDAFASAPYLHDGSAKTLAEAVSAHRGVALGATDLLNLVEFLRQIDGSEPAVAKVSCSDGVKNGTETGVDCGGTCAACAVCAPKSYEAESMSHSTGGATSGGWNIWSNGYISTQHTFAPGATTITVLARGSVAAGVWPNLRVSVGGVVLGNVTVSATSYAPYSFSFTASSGAKEIRVEFTNDLNQNGQDRNLYVDRVDVGCGGTPAATCNDGVKNGSETAVDCGGSCATHCANGQACGAAADCTSGSCVGGLCQAMSSAKVTASLSLQDQWSGGYCANLKVSNGSSAAISTWTVTLNTNQSTIASFWSANFSGTGSTRTVTPLGYNAALGAGASTTVGFCADATGSNWQPSVVSAN